MTPQLTSFLDASERAVQVSDLVGGTSSGRYQTTISGPVLQIGKHKAKILVTNRPFHAGDRPANGDEVWLDFTRLFLTHPASERRFAGFRTPDGLVWTTANTAKPLFESANCPERYDAARLRRVYNAQVTPLWKDTPAPVPGEHEVQARVLEEAAARVWDLPLDYELDPGRGDVRKLLHRWAGEARTGTYPLALPWALLMDDEDLNDFLGDIAAATEDTTNEGGARRVLDALEKVCGTWRALAETQHAHNTADGPQAPSSPVA
ncbi:hypothetical protein OG234_13510 [Streptomyces sp. NBC_01420]|uniref:hypothetical protein n=1 Tax=Streptomyces sp. NBC_01420 TaxID=2903858 RepID=UPI00325460B5